MGGIKIVTDSSADLPEDMARELDITVIPLIVTCDERSYEDISLPREEFWQLAREGRTLNTSQPPMGVFQQAFRSLVDQGYHVLCATVTGRHSGTFATAWSAAQEFADRVTVFDSLSLSWGLAGQVIRAARMAAQGATLESILAALQSLRQRTQVIVLLDSVERLRRGGRAAKIMPAVDRLARALNLKLLLNFVEGEIKLLGVVRSYEKGIARLKDEAQRIASWEHLAVMHTRRPFEAERLARELGGLVQSAIGSIHVGEAGPVLSCHAGEGVIAIVGASQR